MTMTALRSNTGNTGSPKSDWRVDPARSTVSFEVGKQILGLIRLTVRGTIPAVSGEILFDQEEPNRSSAVLAVRTAAVDTGIAKRDEHLRRADFFDVNRHPVATFITRTVRPVVDQPEGFAVEGELIVKGRPRSIVFEVTREQTDSEKRLRIVGRATLNRQALGLAWTSWYITVADEVRVTVTIEAVPR